MSSRHARPVTARRGVQIAGERVRVRIVDCMCARAVSSLAGSGLITEKQPL